MLTGKNTKSSCTQLADRGGRFAIVKKVRVGSVCNFF